MNAVVSSNTPAPSKYAGTRFFHGNASASGFDSALFFRCFRTTGGYTVAWRFNDALGQVEYATSKVGKRDRYCRRVGREVTFGRLSSNQIEGTIPYSAFENSKPTYSGVSKYFAGESFIDQLESIRGTLE